MKNGKIIITNLTKYYGKTRGIENLNLEIKEGEVFGFLGPNGSGKTTTIRCILSILLPNTGEVWINGDLVTRQKASLRDNIGYIPGELFLPEFFRVDEFLTYIESMRNKKSVLKQVLIDKFELPLKKKIGELSKGNKQKVGIIAAFMHDPEVLILDEPTAGLDPLLQNVVYEIILDAKTRGHTIFFSSHNLAEVQKICDRVGIVKDGQLVNIENVESLNKKIPRILKVTLNKPEKQTLHQLDKYLLKIDDLESNLQLMVSQNDPIHKFLEILLPMEPTELSYPPASLEEYFLKFYKEKG